jgi:structure-specific endonuclease subunit SLX1
MRAYLVYCLRSGTGKTYVGCTNNWTRRLRQHNGGLAGGARYTRTGRPWRALFHVTGLTQREALQLEWALKRRRVSRGIAGRLLTLRKMMACERWTRNAPAMAELRDRICVKLFLA